MKKGVRFRPPEVAPGLQRLDVARERLAVRRAAGRPLCLQLLVLAPARLPAAPSPALLLARCPLPQAACSAAWKQHLGDFATSYAPFRSAVQALAALDCLCSLAAVASTPGYCRPQFVADDAPPQLHIEAG